MRSLTLLLIAAITTTGCASAKIPPADLTRHLTATRQIVRVANHGWDDIELSAMRGGTRRVLGVLSAAQNATLMVTDDMLDTDGRLQLVARIEGKRDLQVMQPVRVPQGNYVDWSIENDLSRSTVSLFPL